MSQPDKKVDRRVVRSKGALKKALLQLMAEKEFDAISITEIVELSNYNRGTFYTHYENKEALLSDMIEELIAELLKSFRSPYEHEEIFRIREMTASSVRIFEHILQNASVYTVLLRSNGTANLRERMFRALKDISTGELVYLDADASIDTELLANYSLHGLLGLIFHWIEGGYAHSTAYMQEQLVKIIQWHPAEAKTNIAEKTGSGPKPNPDRKKKG